MKKTLTMRLIEDIHGIPIEELLITKYAEHGNIRGVAKDLGIHFATVWSWSQSLGIDLSKEHEVANV